MPGQMAVEQTSSSMKKAKRRTDITTEKYFNADESNRKFKSSSRTLPPP